MPYSRQRPRLAPTGRITVRLTPAQRDLLLASSHTPKDVAHALHRASVREGKLGVRVTRASLDALILAAAQLPTVDREAERALDGLLRYLESLADRFADPPDTREEEVSASGD